MNVRTHTAASLRGADRYGGRFIGILASLCDRLWVWRERAAQRKMFAGLDDRALRDIALDQATASVEAAKPFWQV